MLANACAARAYTGRINLSKMSKLGTEIRQFSVRFPACYRRVKRSTVWEYVVLVSRRIIPLKRTRFFLSCLLFAYGAVQDSDFSFPAARSLYHYTRPLLCLPAKSEKLSKLMRSL